MILLTALALLAQASDEDDLSRRIARARPEPVAVGSWRAQRIGTPNFLVFSSCEEALFKDVALRLERNFAAYAGFFRVTPKRKRQVKLFLLSGEKEYREFQEQQFGGAVMNPAWYAPGATLLLACDRTVDVKRTNAALRAENDRLRRRLRELEGKPRRACADRIGEIARGIRHNEGVIRELDARLDRTLRHEAFHAFADLYLFEGGAGAAPRWLDEGLGTHFESKALAGDLVR